MFFSLKRMVIGLVEPIALEDGKEYKAKIDTGADSSSIDVELLNKLGEKKIVSHKKIRSALGRSVRPTVILEVEFQGIKFKEKFTVSDRSNMRYKVLIGKDVLKKEGFIIDPQK